MIRGDYYGWDDSLALLDIYRDRMDRRRYHTLVMEGSNNLSDMGMLYLKSFLNNLDDHADADATLAFAKAFLVEVAS